MIIYWCWYQIFVTFNFWKCWRFLFIARTSFNYNLTLIYMFCWSCVVFMVHSYTCFIFSSLISIHILTYAKLSASRLNSRVTLCYLEQFFAKNDVFATIIFPKRFWFSMNLVVSLLLWLFIRESGCIACKTSTYLSIHALCRLDVWHKK